MKRASSPGGGCGLGRGRRCDLVGRRCVARVVILGAVAWAAAGALHTPPASALNPLGPICGAAGWVSGIAGKACSVVQHGGKLIGAGKKLLGGHLGSAAKTLLGSGSSGPSAGQVIGLAALVAWVNGGAKAALSETATVLDRTTRPQLGTTWFSSTYWRMAGISALLTLPFLFAAAVQALLNSDLTLLLRAALGYLPLSMLAVGVAAPLTMLLLAASDEMSSIISAAAGQAGGHFLAQLGRYTGILSLVARSPFLVFLIGLLTAAGAIVLWLEMLMRQAAIYIVVLMLPLAFAALVWPARRVWAVRAIELLVALILSKFVIVAVLSLGGTALGRGGGVGGGMLAGLVLVLLGTVAPWALLKLLPLTELASGAAGHLRSEVPRVLPVQAALDRRAGGAGEWATAVATRMRLAAAEAADGARGATVDGAPADVIPADGAPTDRQTIDGQPGEGQPGETPSVEAATLEGDATTPDDAPARPAPAAPVATAPPGGTAGSTDTSELDELRERTRQTLILGPSEPPADADPLAPADPAQNHDPLLPADPAEDHDPLPPADPDADPL
jgi:hypothetical protein